MTQGDPFYPEQLRFLAAACEALNELHRAHPDQELYLGQVKVHFTEDGVTPMGWLIDHLGGSWSFTPRRGDES